MVNRVLQDSMEHRFVRIIASRNLLRQICGRKLSNPLLQQIPALVPARHEFLPRNRRLRPFLLRVPARHRMALRRVSNPFIPQQQMLQQLRNGMSPGNRRRRGKFRRNLRQKLDDRRPIPSALDRHGPVGISNFLDLFAHVPSADTHEKFPRLRWTHFTSHGFA